jgi:hypothetical protein
MAKNLNPLKPPYDPQVRASGVQRAISCPGHVALCRWVDPSPSSVYALEGTCAHDLAEECVKKQITPDRYIGLTRKVKIFDKAGEHGWHEYEVTEEMAFNVAVYYQYINSRRNHDRDTTVKVETRYKVPSIHKLMSGTADTEINSPKILEIVDLKFGVGKYVYEVNNGQLTIYGLGALEKNGNDYDELWITIVQPRHFKDPKVRTWKIKNVKEWQKQQTKRLCEVYKKVQLKTHERDKTTGKIKRLPLDLNLSGECGWCEALMCCPAVQQEFENFAMKGMNDMFSLTGRQLAGHLGKVEGVKAYAKALESYALERAKTEEIPGFKIVMAQGTRKKRGFSDKEAVEDLLINELLCDEDDVLNKSLKTPNQLQKALDRDDWSEVEKLVTPSTTTTFKLLVPVSDEREEYKGAETDFDEDFD